MLSLLLPVMIWTMQIIMEQSPALASIFCTSLTSNFAHAGIHCVSTFNSAPCPADMYPCKPIFCGLVASPAWLWLYLEAKLIKSSLAEDIIQSLLVMIHAVLCYLPGHKLLLCHVSA